jgi:hypothetical protein
MAPTRPASSSEGARVIPMPLRTPRVPAGVSELPPVPSRVASAYELAGRAKKVERLVAWIDSVAVSRGIDPLKHPKDVALLLRAVDEQGWVVVAKKAKVNPPSAETIAAVFGEYDRRASLVPPAPVVRFVVVHRPQPGFAYKLESEPFDTRAEAEAVLKQRRELTTGGGFPVEAWIEERTVRS